MLKSKFFFATISLMFAANIFLSNCTLQQKGNIGNALGNNEVDKSEKIAYKIPKVLPPLKDMDVPFKSYKVAANQESKIVIEETGTTINIPADAFVDKNGNPVKGPVEIKFREFHNAAEVILSGIPMVDPVTGKYMETAGMFEIRGTSNGNEIFIKEDKNLDVKLASYNEGNHFDYFSFDESKGRWETLVKNVEPEINIVKVEKIKALDCKSPQKPVKPVKRGSSKNLVFELNFNYQKFPELEMFRNVLWQYAGNPTDADNPEKMEDFGAKWTDIDIKKGDGYYDLTLRTHNKKLKTRVLPLLSSKDYEVAMKEFDKKLADFEKVKKFHEDRKAIAQRSADILRASQVRGFGIYNHDCWRENVSNLNVTVDFDSEYDHLEKADLQYFIISRNNKAVVPSTNLKSLRYSRGFRTKIIAVLPDNRVATFNEDDFAALDDKGLKNGSAVTLKMPTSRIKLEKAEDLLKILSM